MTLSSCYLSFMNDPVHAQLGALVRARRDEAGLSQQGLAEEAGVSRESVNRLERATGPWEPHPVKTAQVLAVLGITLEDVEEAVPAGPLLDGLRREMPRFSTAKVIEFVNRKALDGASPSVRADIVLVTPEGVTMFVEVKGNKQTTPRVRRQLSDALGEFGWVVSAPVL